MTAPEIVAIFRDCVPLPIHKKPTYAMQRVQRMIRMFMGEPSSLSSQYWHNCVMGERIFTAKLNILVNLHFLSAYPFGFLIMQYFYEAKGFPNKVLSQV